MHFLRSLLLLALALPLAADIHLIPNPNGPLAGRTIVFSPGHGYNEYDTGWRYQRGVVHDLLEDIHTNEIFIEYVQRYLANAGARVESVRERSFLDVEVIVDNAGSGYSETGSWTASSNVNGYYATGYRWASASVNTTATAEFRPTLPKSARYPVYVWFPTASDRVPDARFEVHHSGGVSVVTVDQSDLGDHWLFLGEFHFEAGNSGRVVLSNQSSDPSKVVIADAVRFGAGIGPSGKVRWRESAKTFLPHKGYVSGYGDVTVRPRYATWLAGGDTSQWRTDFLYFALHTNASGSGSGSTARGLSTFSYSNGRPPSWGSAGAAHYPTNPSPLTAESDALRAAVHEAVLEAVRAEFVPSWSDRSLHVMNFGELREARNMPSALIELGFHDNVDDTDLQRNARFRATAARGIYRGIMHYWAPGATIVPLPPDGLSLRNLGNGQVEVRWDAVLDPLEPSAVPTGYKVYTSSNGRGFDNGTVVSGTSLTLQGLALGERVYVRVAALNAGGESLPSHVGGALVGAAGTVIVDGFDRPYAHSWENIDSRYTADYVVEHLDAFAAAVSGIDFAANEAVIRGHLQLGNYDLVDWFVGRESTADDTFDATEQALVEAYLNGGGALFASGTEIAWDLEARNGGVPFLHNVLSAKYGADDAGTRDVTAVGSGPFAGVGSLVFDDGSNGTYDAAYPDVLLPMGNAAEVLMYGSSGAAGIATSSPRKVVLLGFPLETVVDPQDRRTLASLGADFLVQGNGGNTGNTGGGNTGNTGGGNTGNTGGGNTGNTGNVGNTGGGNTGNTGGGSSGSRVTSSGGGSSSSCAVAPQTSPWGAFLVLGVLLVLFRRRRA